MTQEYKKVDANLIVSPKTTQKLYSKENLDEAETPAGQTDNTPVSLPDEVDGVEENMFPSAG